MVGIAGLVLPLIPGMLFISLGIFMIMPSMTLQVYFWASLKILKRTSVTFHIPNLFVWRKIGSQNSAIALVTSKQFPIFLKKTSDILNDGCFDQFKNELIRSNSTMRSIKSFIFMGQTHSDHIRVISPANSTEAQIQYLQDTDAVISCQPNTALIVMSADCLPLLLYARDKSKTNIWIAAVHAGWKGSRALIVKKTVDELLKQPGIQASQIKAFIGPHIRDRNYAVGEEFAQYFSSSSLARRAQKLYMNLAKENIRQLIQAGLSKQNIIDCGICSYVSSEHYFSYRKQGSAAGRTLSVIALP